MSRDIVYRLKDSDSPLAYDAAREIQNLRAQLAATLDALTDARLETARLVATQRMAIDAAAKAIGASVRK